MSLSKKLFKAEYPILEALATVGLVAAMATVATVACKSDWCRVFPWQEQLRESGQAFTQSGINGLVTIGPICPVVQNPPSSVCADRPYQTTIRITNKSGNLIKHISVNADGRFSIKLPAGVYLVGPVDGASSPPSASTQTITVDPGIFTDIVIQFDSGIR